MISRKNVRLVNHISDTRKFDVAESLEVYKAPKMNFSTGIKATVTCGFSSSGGALMNRIIISVLSARE